MTIDQTHINQITGNLGEDETKHELFAQFKTTGCFVFVLSLFVSADVLI